eukprot:1665629-Ditylum_brightwellii.AAC.1
MEGKLCQPKKASAMAAPLIIIFSHLPGKEDTLSQGFFLGCENGCNIGDIGVAAEIGACPL